MKEETYTPGLAPGALRPATASDVRSVLQGYLAQGGIPPAAITVALPLLDLAQAPLGYKARYKAAGEGFADLARELQSQGIELKGSPGCLSWEIRVLPRDGHDLHSNDLDDVKNGISAENHQPDPLRFAQGDGQDLPRAGMAISFTRTMAMVSTGGMARGSPPRCPACRRRARR